MKNFSKILYVICILIIIAGAIIAKTLGVNYSLEYSKGKNIEIYFDNSTEKSDIEEIAKEIFGKDSKIYEIERFKDAFSIRVKDVNDEQKANLISKINEKYSIELADEDIKVFDIPKVSGWDLIKEYIKPTIISLAIILVYLSIRYRKIGSIKTAILTLLKTAVITGAYFGLVIIVRMPIVNMYTIPVGLLIAVISLITICYKNETKLEKIIVDKK